MLDIKWSKPYKVTIASSQKWKREWIIPIEMLDGFFAFWRKNKFKLMVDGYGVSKSKLNNAWFFYQVKDNLALFLDLNQTESPAKPTSVVVSNQAEVSFELPFYKLKNVTGIRPWQINACERLVSAITYWGAAVDGSDLGVGKSYQAIGAIRELDAPFIIVSPKAVMNQWSKLITNHFSLHNRCKGIINYELLVRGRKDSDIASYVLKRDTGRKHFTWKLPANTIIVWDEAHKLKNFKTKNSKCCIEAHKQGFRQLFLSATLATSPLDLKTIGICLKMFKNGKTFYEWAYAHGVYKGNWGMEFNNDPKELKKINKYLFEDRGVRNRRDEIPNFPECEIIVASYTIDEDKVAEINRNFKEMAYELKRLDNLLKKEENQLVIRLRYRQRIELLKTDLFVELANEGLEAGMSVLLFVNYSETIRVLSERLNTKCIYSGEVSTKDKLKNIAAFQANDEKVIIIQCKSGNAGLNIGDEHGGHPRLSIISPDDSAVVIKQCCGRTWRENSKSKSIVKIPFVADSVEEAVVDNMNNKINNIDLVNDGDLKVV